jgi:hypothetical protein
MPLPPVPLVPSLEGAHVLSHFGKSTQVKTAIGRIMAVSTARVVVDVAGGPMFILDTEEAWAIAQAVMHARFAAEEWGKKLAGHFTLRLRAVSPGRYDATYHGETRPLRLSQARKQERECRQCRKHVTLYWCDMKGPGYFVEVCDPCAKRLAAAPEALRST